MQLILFVMSFLNQRSRPTSMSFVWYLHDCIYWVMALSIGYNHVQDYHGYLGLIDEVMLNVTLCCASVSRLVRCYVTNVSGYCQSSLFQMDSYLIHVDHPFFVLNPTFLCIGIIGILSMKLTFTTV